MLPRALSAVGLLLCILCGARFSWAADSPAEYGQLLPEQLSVPQNLLNLVHSREVQKELGLTAQNLVQWEKLLREIDAVWWPARILSASEQRKVIATLEVKLMEQGESLLGRDGVKRLRQIELQSQGVRMLARPEVGKMIRLDTRQHTKLAELFSKTDELGTALSTTKPPAGTEKQQAFAKAKADESKKVDELLTSAQWDRVREVVGKPFDTTQLARIYPLAPVLIDSGFWAGKDRVSLESLRGNVVVVHFYAFQCHNCVANFDHYKRWDEKLGKKGVRLIGIQTPETAAEHDPDKVIAAAKKEGFQFPVLIDIENKNWDAWGNTMWPTVYVIDKQGYIRFWWQGELNWQGAIADQKIESIIDELVKESETEAPNASKNSPAFPAEPPAK